MKTAVCWAVPKEQTMAAPTANWMAALKGVLKAGSRAAQWDCRWAGHWAEWRAFRKAAPKDDHLVDSRVCGSAEQTEQHSAGSKVDQRAGLKACQRVGKKAHHWAASRVSRLVAQWDGHSVGSKGESKAIHSAANWDDQKAAQKVCCWAARKVEH